MDIDTKDIQILAINVANILMNSCVTLLKKNPVASIISVSYLLLYIFIPSTFWFLTYLFTFVVFIGGSLYIYISVRKAKGISKNENSSDGKACKLAENGTKKYNPKHARSVRRRKAMETVAEGYTKSNYQEKGTTSRDGLVGTSAESLLKRGECSSSNVIKGMRSQFHDDSFIGSKRYSSEVEGLSSDYTEDEDDDRKGDERKAILWNDDDQKNLMDLGVSEIERNKRLESLIARRRARKLTSVHVRKTLLNMGGKEPLNLNTSLMIPKINHFLKDPGQFSPTPGSAPSVLLPMRNPFDLPYEPHEEKPNLTGDSFHQEFLYDHLKEGVFCRHESFSLGAFYPRDLMLDQPSGTKTLLESSKLGSRLGKEKEHETSQKDENKLEKESSEQGIDANISDHDVATEASKDGADLKIESESSEHGTEVQIENKIDQMSEKGQDGEEFESKEVVVEDNIGRLKSPSASSEEEAPICKIDKEAILRSLSIAPRNKAADRRLDEILQQSEHLYYDERTHHHTPSNSIASDMQVEVSEVGSPPQTSDEENMNIEKEKEKEKEMWVASKNLSQVDKSESRSREIREVREADIIGVGFSRIGVNDEEFHTPRDDFSLAVTPRLPSFPFQKKLYQTIAPSSLSIVDESNTDTNAQPGEPSDIKTVYEIESSIDKNDIHDQQVSQSEGIASPLLPDLVDPSISGQSGQPIDIAMIESSVENNETQDEHIAQSELGIDLISTNPNQENIQESNDISIALKESLNPGDLNNASDPNFQEPSKIEETSIANSETISSESVEPTLVSTDDKQVIESSETKISEESTLNTPQQEDTPIPESIIDSIPELTIEPIHESSIDPIPESMIDLIPGSLIDPIPELTIDPIPESTIDLIPGSLIDPIPELMIDPESTIDLIPESTMDPIPEPTIDPIPESTIVAMNDPQEGELIVEPVNEQLVTTLTSSVSPKSVLQPSFSISSFSVESERFTMDNNTVDERPSSNTGSPPAQIADTNVETVQDLSTSSMVEESANGLVVDDENTQIANSDTSERLTSDNIVAEEFKPIVDADFILKKKSFKHETSKSSSGSADRRMSLDTKLFGDSTFGSSYQKPETSNRRKSFDMMFDDQVIINSLHNQLGLPQLPGLWSSNQDLTSRSKVPTGKAKGIESAKEMVVHDENTHIAIDNTLERLISDDVVSEPTKLIVDPDFIVENNSEVPETSESNAQSIVESGFSLGNDSEKPETSESSAEPVVDTDFSLGTDFEKPEASKYIAEPIVEPGSSLGMDSEKPESSKYIAGPIVDPDFILGTDSDKPETSESNAEQIVDPVSSLETDSEKPETSKSNAEQIVDPISSMETDSEKPEASKSNAEPIVDPVSSLETISENPETSKSIAEPIVDPISSLETDSEKPETSKFNAEPIVDPSSSLKTNSEKPETSNSIAEAIVGPISSLETISENRETSKSIAEPLVDPISSLGTDSEKPKTLKPNAEPIKPIVEPDSSLGKDSEKPETSKSDTVVKPDTNLGKDSKNPETSKSISRSGDRRLSLDMSLFDGDSYFGNDKPETSPVDYKSVNRRKSLDQGNVISSVYSFWGRFSGGEKSKHKSKPPTGDKSQAKK